MTIKNTMNSRKPLIAAAALVAVLSAPFAFAQTATPEAQDPAAASAAAPASGAPAKKSWSDVDTDKNGSLSKSEASSVPALSQVFEQADSDANGALTADEYKAYVAKAQSGAAGNSGGKK